MKKLSKLSLGLIVAACAFYNVSAFSDGSNAERIVIKYETSSGKALASNADGTKYCCTSGESTCSASTECKVRKIDDVV